MVTTTTTTTTEFLVECLNDLDWSIAAVMAAYSIPTICYRNYSPSFSDGDPTSAQFDIFIPNTYDWTFGFCFINSEGETDFIKTFAQLERILKSDDDEGEISKTDAFDLMNLLKAEPDPNNYFSRRENLEARFSGNHSKDAFTALKRLISWKVCEDSEGEIYLIDDAKIKIVSREIYN